jgi:hypothetical protein
VKTTTAQFSSFLSRQYHLPSSRTVGVGGRFFLFFVYQQEEEAGAEREKLIIERAFAVVVIK